MSIYRCLYLDIYAARYIVLPCCAINPINPISPQPRTGNGTARVPGPELTDVVVSPAS